MSHLREIGIGAVTGGAPMAGYVVGHVVARWAARNTGLIGDAAGVLFIAFVIVAAMGLVWESAQ